MLITPYSDGQVENGPPWAIFSNSTGQEDPRAGVGLFEAQDQAPKTAGWFLNQIGQLYKWERQLRDNRAGLTLRQAVRCADSRMVFRRIGRALIRLQPRYLPQSPMGQAINYALIPNGKSNGTHESGSFIYIAGPETTTILLGEIEALLSRLVLYCLNWVIIILLVVHRIAISHFSIASALLP
jgi:hypothetical protein